MEIKVTNEKDNPLLERKELDIHVVYEGATPRREELKNALIAMLDSNKELLVLDSLKVKFGAQELTAEARIYKKKEKVLEVEPGYIIARNFPEGGAKKEKPAEKEAPKAEEKKPEKKEKPPEAKKAEEPKPEKAEKKEAPKAEDVKPEEPKPKEEKEKAEAPAKEEKKEGEQK